MQSRQRWIAGLMGLALSAGVLVLTDAMSGPGAVLADAGASLTEPIPPATGAEREASRRHQIGWIHAKKRLQADMPLGRGIAVGQVEGNLESGYLANTNHQGLPGTGFIPESGAAKLSGHATAVATYIAGPQSAGQGVRAVHGWTVADWFGEGYLNAQGVENPREDHPARVFNHSWIAPSSPNAPLILRRVDYAVDTHDVLMVVGVDNKPGAIPHLLASAYNTISVGVGSGNHSDGRTTVEGEGRCKPEIVAPGDKTSYTTGIVTGVCAALLEFADRLAQVDERNKDAPKSEVIKAVLFAGAQRGADWSAPAGEPLDRKLGVGSVDLDRALVILEGGHATPGEATDQRYGWSFAGVEPGQVRDYPFTVDVAQGQTGVALVWHRRVLGGKANLVNQETGESQEIWNPSQFVPNLNLGIIQYHEDGRETLLAASASKVDNVELIHLPELGPGKYSLRVARVKDEAAIAWDYALAWRIEGKVVAE